MYLSVVWNSSLRVPILLANAAASILTSHLVVSYYGAHSFGLVALVGSIAALMTFADLGMGAALTNAASVPRTSDSGTDHLKVVALQATRIALLMSLGVAAVSSVVLFAGLWPPILGIREPRFGQYSIAAWATAALFALGLPLALNRSLLLGKGLNHLVTVVMVIRPMSILGLTYLGIKLGVAPGVVAIAPAIGLFLAYLGLKQVGARTAGMSLPYLPQGWARNKLGTAIWKTAAPAFVINLALPVLLQTDQVILAHARPGDLAQYAVTLQVYTPIWSVISTGGMTLWSVFARQRALGQTGLRSLLGSSLLMAIMAVAGGLVLEYCSPWVASLIAGTTIRPSIGLRTAFAVLLVLQAVLLVTSVYMTAPRQLMFQAVCVSLAALANLPISVALANRWGAPGPVVSSAIVIAIGEILPFWIYIWRARRRAFLNENQAGSHAL